MSIRNDLVPSKIEAIMYAVLAGGMVVLSNTSYFVSSILEGVDKERGGVSGLANLYTDQVLNAVDQLPVSPFSAVFIFWSLAGVLVFSILQSVYNVSLELKENVDVDTHFLHPKNYTHKGFWLGVLFQFLIHTALYVISLVVIAAIYFILLPSVNSIFRDSTNAGGLALIIPLICSLVLLYIGVLMLGLLLKLLFKQKQII